MIKELIVKALSYILDKLGFDVIPQEKPIRSVGDCSMEGCDGELFSNKVGIKLGLCNTCGCLCFPK